MPPGAKHRREGANTRQRAPGHSLAGCHTQSNPLACFEELRFVKLLGTGNLSVLQLQCIGSPQLPNLSDRKDVSFAFNCDDECSIFFISDSIRVRQRAECSDRLQYRGSAIQNRSGNFPCSLPLRLRSTPLHRRSICWQGPPDEFGRMIGITSEPQLTGERTVQACDVVFFNNYPSWFCRLRLA